MSVIPRKNTNLEGNVERIVSTRAIRLLLVGLVVFAFAVPETFASPIQDPSTPPSPGVAIESGTNPGRSLLAKRTKKKRRKKNRRGKRRRRQRQKAPSAAPAAQPSTDDVAPLPAEGGPEPSTETIRRGSRVEFDGRLVQGQTAQGALLLLARKRSELRSMVEERTSYREEILMTVYPEESELERSDSDK